MTRTLPYGMHYKECRILVEAAMMYYPKMTVGRAVIEIWTMPPELRAIISTITCHIKATDAILRWQDR